MSDETARVRFRVGDLELEYQGPSSYIENGLTDLFEKVLGYGDLDARLVGEATQPAAAAPEKSPPRRMDTDISLATMISRLGGNTGTDVVFMAAAHLAVCQERSRFSRAEVLENAKSADGYYKKSISSNLSSYLDRLLKDGRLTQYSDKSYSLPESQRKRVRSGLLTDSHERTARHLGRHSRPPMGRRPATNGCHPVSRSLECGR